MRDDVVRGDGREGEGLRFRVIETACEGGLDVDYVGGW